MARYTGPKARVNRRLGTLVYEGSGASRASARRPQPPGMHTRGRRPSNYGLALMEKQKIKHYYGLGERQLRRYFEKVSNKKGNTGEMLLMLCEQRLDNVIRRAGYTRTRPQARQGVAHGHFQVNGRTAHTPSIQLRTGDVVRVRNRPNLQTYYKGVAESTTASQCDFITVETAKLEVIVTALPSIVDVSLPVDVGQVVAFLSR